MSETEDDAMRTEMRVRRALGLAATNVGSANSAKASSRALAPQANNTGSRDPEAKHERRRFVQDGEVPVVVVRREQRNAPNARLQELEAALAAEQAARSSVMRALEAAHVAIQSLRTRLTHAELAHAEAMTAVPSPAANHNAGRPATKVKAKPDAEVVLQQPSALALDNADVADMSKVSTRPRRSGKPKQPKPVRWWESNFRVGTSTG